MNIVSVLIALGLGTVITMIKLISSTKNEVFGKYDGDVKLIPWNYSEQQGEWVSPQKPFSPSEMNGNIYIGKDEVDTTWKNFNEKNDLV